LAADALSYQPRGLLRNGHLQTVLASVWPFSWLIRLRAARLRSRSQELLLDCGDGVRLQAFLSRAAQGGDTGSERLAILLHGWEGSAEATYVLSLGSLLLARGFDVVRLNLRDHGATHHLNREIFHSCRLSEVVGATRAIAQRFPQARLYLAGFSLGGCTAAALLGAISASSRFSSADRDAARGPREFPDLADHLPGLLDNSAIFRASWARMSDSYRDERFKAALLLAPGRSVQGFSEQSLAAIKTPTRIIVGESDFVAPGAIWLHERLRTSTLELLPQGTGHYVFLPEATSAGRLADPVCCIDAPGIDRRTVHGHAFTSALGLFLSV